MAEWLTGELKVVSKEHRQRGPLDLWDQVCVPGPWAALAPPALRLAAFSFTQQASALTQLTCLHTRHVEGFPSAASAGPVLGCSFADYHFKFCIFIKCQFEFYSLGVVFCAHLTLPCSPLGFLGTCQVHPACGARATAGPHSTVFATSFSQGGQKLLLLGAE